MYVDPGINVTGYAVYDYRIVNKEEFFDIKAYGVIQPDWDGISPSQDRIRSIYYPIRCLAKENGVSRLFVEEPPSTVYGDRKTMSINHCIARAQNVFKLVSVAHSIIASFDKKIPIETILPVQWEPSLKDRRGEEIKAWSVRMGNVIIENHATPESVANYGMLKTRVDSNCADAINIGYRVSKDLISGKRDLLL